MAKEYFNSEQMKDILEKKRIRTLDMYGSVLMSVIEYNDSQTSAERFWRQEAGSILTLMPLYYNCRILDFGMKFGSAITATTYPEVKLVCFDNINPEKSIAKIDITLFQLSADSNTYYDLTNTLIYTEFEREYNTSENKSIWDKIKDNNKFYLGLEIKTPAGTDLNNGFYTAFFIQTIHGAPSEMPLINRSIAPTGMSGN